jgi:molybdate transport system substrate-binding protein
MRTMRGFKPFIPGAMVTLAITVAQPSAARGEEIRVWTARALAIVLADVGSEVERTTGHTLKVSSDLPPNFARRAQAGDEFDLFISASAAVDDWIKQGRLVASTRTELVRSAIGVAVRRGASKPEISSVDAFKRALLAAKSIAYLRVGGGAYLAGVLDRLGIADAIKAKVTRPDTDIVAELVASGEIELGIVVQAQIVTTAGVELVGPLPPPLQNDIVFTGAVSANAQAPAAARQLISFLTGAQPPLK